VDVWARPSREGVGNGEPWIKARVTPVLVIEMSRKSLGGWRAKYSRGWQKDVSAQGDGEPHVLGTEVATFGRFRPKWPSPGFFPLKSLKGKIGYFPTKSSFGLK